MKKRLLSLLLLGLLCISLLAGCGGGNEDKETVSPSESGEAEVSTDTAMDEGEGNATSATEGMKVAYVTAGAQGDNGFTDSVVRGMERIEKDYGCEIIIIENNNDSAKFSQSMEACFQWGPDVVFADAYGFEELFAQYADQYPDVIMVNLDFVIQNDNDTISSVTFINEEGSFLAGVLAAKVTTSDLEYANAEKKVGFVGGNDIDVIRGFLKGFEQGVAYVDPEIEVVSTFVGDFFDPVKGKQAANQLYAQGCDIIFQAAGTSGNGVLEAASEQNKYAIGVDSNQNGLYPGNIVSSMIKDLEGAVYMVFTDIAEDKFQPGNVYDMGAGPAGVFLALDEYSKDILPADFITELEQVQDMIYNGEITIEKYEA